MALEKILLDGSEDGESAGVKINTAFDNVDENTEALTQKIGYNYRTPKGAMNLFTPYSVSLNDTTYTVLEYDTIAMDRGGVTPNLLDNSISIPKTDSYELDIAVDADFNQNEQLDIMIFINDEAVNQVPLSIQGDGNGKPVAICWHTTFPFNIGDKVDMRCRNGDTGSVGMNFRRIYFSIKLDI